MHTPTPYTYSNRNWRNEPQPYDRYIVGDTYMDDEGCLLSTSVAIVPGNATSGTLADETAAFICLACNSHDRLVSALQDELAAAKFRGHEPSERTLKLLEFLARPSAATPAN